MGITRPPSSLAEPVSVASRQKERNHGFLLRGLSRLSFGPILLVRTVNMLQLKKRVLPKPGSNIDGPLL